MLTAWRDSDYSSSQHLYGGELITPGMSRLGAGSMKRSPRVFPDDEIPYKNWVLPRGVGAFSAIIPSVLELTLSCTDPGFHDDILYPNRPDCFPQPDEV